MQFDEDYEDFDDVADKPPEMKAIMDSFFGITPDYFSHVLDDPPDSELPGLIEKLRRLEEQRLWLAAALSITLLRGRHSG